MRTWAVVVAAGRGSRFGAQKQFAMLEGRPIISWSLDVARRACSGVVLVLPPDSVEQPWDADVVVPGGVTRSDSVRRGLAAVPVDAEIIAVHDAARPLSRIELWESVIGAVVAGADGAIPAAPVTDTVKKVMPDGRLVTLDRSELVSVQTPQAFRAEILRSAHAGGGDATDDASLVEAAGGQVVLIDGPSDNLKVTAPTDLIVAAALVGSRL